MEKIKNLKGNNSLKYNILKRGNWLIEEDSNAVWNEMSIIIRRVTERFLRTKKVSNDVVGKVGRSKKLLRRNKHILKPNRKL